MNDEADFRVSIGVRNNALLSAIEKHGFKPGPKLAEQAGISYHTLIHLVSMKISPLDWKGNWKPAVIKLATFLDEMPGDLFYDTHIDPLEKNRVELRVNKEEMSVLLNPPADGDPVRMLEHVELSAAVEKALSGLSPRKRQVLELRMEGLSLAEIAEKFDVTPERIRQVEAGALRNMRHPSRAHALRQFLEHQT